MSDLVLAQSAFSFDTIKSHADWMERGKLLAHMERHVQFAIGDWLNFGREKYERGRYEDGLKLFAPVKYRTLEAWSGVARAYETPMRIGSLSFNHHQVAATLEMEERDGVLQLAAAQGWSVSELRGHIASQRHSVERPPLPDGKFRCLVVDPPWPMQKIEREVRPNQAAVLDYPTMSLDEIRDFPIPDVAADDCHLYLWTTHKYLPNAWRIAEAWGFRYQCQMTWIKNVGMTPFSWMYSTEHALFCTKGNLKLERMGMRLDFTAKVRGHSAKPEEFYELVRQASPGPRLDVFSRREIEGFQGYGNELPAGNELGREPPKAA